MHGESLVDRICEAALVPDRWSDVLEALVIGPESANAEFLFDAESDRYARRRQGGVGRRGHTGSAGGRAEPSCWQRQRALDPARSDPQRPACVAHIVPLSGAVRDPFANATALLLPSVAGQPGTRPDASILRMLFDLSAAESRLAAALATGIDNGSGSGSGSEKACQ